ncbi:hypothetical protein K1719_042997 [Acacia pycnantha]|nr:hypothetical protein K1719_042997 [Acacia pycnantha]
MERKRATTFKLRSRFINEWFESMAEIAHNQNGVVLKRWRGSVLPVYRNRLAHTKYKDLSNSFSLSLSLIRPRSDIFFSLGFKILYIWGNKAERKETEVGEKQNNVGS